LTSEIRRRAKSSSRSLQDINLFPQVNPDN
jgi:hypothetical protein